MKGFHHFYLGLFLEVLGWILFYFGYSSWVFYPGTFFILFGIILCIDDLIQHFIQRFKPNYTSILHRLYVNTLGKIEFIKKLNEFFDRIFGL